MIEIINEYIKNGSTTSKLGNISSICMEYIDDLNWVGFYLYDETSKKLVLDAFSGKKATALIDPSEGVCGCAFTTREIQNVDNVHNFCGHIACDLNSKSELVIPLIKGDKVLGVLDIDAPIYNRFDQPLVETLIQVSQISLEIL